MKVAQEVAELVKKNFRNLIRSKIGSLIVILGPLIVIFLAGLAFDNSNVYAVKIGAFRPDDVPVTQTMLVQLQKQFTVIEFQSEKECVDAIKQSDINTCMVFAPNFKVGVRPQNQLTFYVDYSRMNLVYAIERAMTDEIGDESFAASQDLTKVLLNTLDFTKEEVKKQRSLVTQLTTENELTNRNVQDLIAEWGDMNLAFDEGKFSVDEVTKSKTQVKQWSDNALTLGSKGISKATSFIDAADKLVKQSSAPQGTKDSLLANFKKSVDELKALEADLAATTNLTKESFARFDAQMAELISAIKDTKSQLTDADTSREFSVRVLTSITVLLDKSLLSVLAVQQSLNEIDHKIGAIEITDPEAIAQPIAMSIRPIVQERSYLNYLFPVLCVLILMFTALLITPTLILLDKNSPAAFRSFMTPVRDSSVLLAHFATAFLMLLVQLVVVLGVVSVFFGNQVVSSVPKALLVLLLTNSLFVLLGMLIGFVFRHEETATLGAVMLGALFLFVSDVIVPLESMPEVFAYIASFNPYVLGSQLLRKVLLFDSSLLSVLPDLLIMVGYIVALAVVVTGAYLVTRRENVQQVLDDIRPFVAKLRWRRKQQ